MPVTPAARETILLRPDVLVTASVFNHEGISNLNYPRSGPCRARLRCTKQDQLSRFQQQLSNSDPKVRVAAFEDLLKANLATAGNDIVPLLSKALRDPDEKVRDNAAASLAAIAFSTLPKFRQIAADKTDLRSYPPLKDSLVATFNDADENTRKNALAAYVMTFEVPPAVQNDLVLRYESERANSVFRTAILGALTIDGTPTPAAKALLVRVAGTPAGAVHLAQVIKDSKAPPVELLPIFVNQLSTATDSPSRSLFARAIR
jgi:HEAT repeat protein